MKIYEKNFFVGNSIRDDGVVSEIENDLLDTQTVTKYTLHANKFIVGSRKPKDRTFIVLEGQATVEVSPGLQGPQEIKVDAGEVVIIPAHSFFNLKNTGDFMLNAILVTSKG